METFFIKLLQFALSISLLVLLHEGGHFFFARLFKVKVEKFYLFFNPWFSLFKYKPKNSDTTYGLGWLPLGGYCKIAGMIDESMDKEQMKKPAEEWEFRSKPAWQRLLIMIGGVLVNFVLALFIYSMVLFYWGDSYVDMKNMNMGMKFNSEAKALGFKDGDVLLGTNQGEFSKFNVDVYRQLSTATTATVKRNGKEIQINLPGEINLLSMVKSQPAFVAPLIPTQIDSVMPASSAAKAGLKKGDKILSINNKAVDSWSEFINETGILTDMLTQAKTKQDSINIRTVTIAYQAASKTMPDTAKILLDNNMLMGVGQASIYSFYKPTTKEYGFFESFPAGINNGFGVLKGYVDDLKYLFSAEGAKSLGGFGTIGGLFPPTWDWYLFWNMTAFLSIILAFMNILPIPALDGGHVLFLLYEIITRKKPGENFMIYAEYVGLAILFLLMIAANLNDILRWLGYM